MNEKSTLRKVAKDYLTHTKNEKAITLIALVVTIVVLLILAGISISMLSGENGIITKAQNAKMETKAAIVSDERDMWIHERFLSEQLDKTPKSMENILLELQQKGVLTEEDVSIIKNDSNNEITIGSKTISFKVEEKTNLSLLKAGDYVNYIPTEGTYKVADGKFGSGYTTEDGYQSFTTETGDSALKWRILSIDEETGKIELISDELPRKAIYLKGDAAYNHGVDILNDLCNTLYSKIENGEKIAVARSLNINDVNRKTTYNYQMYQGEYGHYGDIIDFSNYGLSFQIYPNLYKNEDGYYIGKDRKGGGIDESTGLDDGIIDSNTGITSYSKVAGFTDDCQEKEDISATYTYYEYPINDYLNKNLGSNSAPEWLLGGDANVLLASRTVKLDYLGSEYKISFGLRKWWYGKIVANEFVHNSGEGGGRILLQACCFFRSK